MNKYILIAVILLIGVILISQQKKEDRLLTFLICVSVVLFLSMVELNEDFINFAPVNGGCKVGEFDALKIKGINNTGVEKPLVSDISIFTPTGKNVLLTEDMMARNHFSTVDGTDSTPHHMFMLAHNQCDVGCCPSTYSCSKGCVCLTAEQKKFIQTRGGNKSYNGNPDM